MSVTLTSPTGESHPEEGPYRTADEVIEETLSLLDERERLLQLRAKIQIGIDQLDRGEGTSR